MLIFNVKNFLVEFGSMVFYGIALLLSVKHYSKYFDSIFKYFPIIIGYTFLTELLGANIKNNEGIQIIFITEHAINNSLIYNILDIAIYSYFFYVFWKSIKSQDHKNLIKYGSILFCLASLINPFIQDFTLYPQVYAISIGSMNLVLCIIFYFYQLNGNKNKLPNINNLLFWVAIGLLIFYTVYPFFMVIGIFYLDFYIKYNLNTIFQVLLSLMYLCFIIGFINMRRIKPIEEE